MAEPKEDVLPVIHLRIRISKPLEEVWNDFLDPIMMLLWLGRPDSAWSEAPDSSGLMRQPRQR